MKIGSGQGLIHAAAVSSAAFLHRIELNGPGLARRDFQRKNNIHQYLRYADNLLFVLFDDNRCSRLRISIANLDNIYTTKLEEAGPDSVDFLDLQIFKGPRFALTGRFDFCPILRNEGPVLTSRSAHHVSVNSSWPIAFLSRLRLRRLEPGPTCL